MRLFWATREQNMQQIKLFWTIRGQKKKTTNVAFLGHSDPRNVTDALNATFLGHPSTKRDVTQKDRKGVANAKNAQQRHKHKKLPKPTGAQTLITFPVSCA